MDQIKSLEAEASKCICKGNWQLIVKESEPYFDKVFLDDKGKRYSFIGIIHASDDYYYGMLRISDNKLVMLSCVGAFNNFGFTPTD